MRKDLAPVWGRFAGGVRKAIALPMNLAMDPIEAFHSLERRKGRIDRVIDFARLDSAHRLREGTRGLPQAGC